MLKTAKRRWKEEEQTMSTNVMASNGSQPCAERKATAAAAIFIDASQPGHNSRWRNENVAVNQAAKA
jgi:hypothetical protein